MNIKKDTPADTQGKTTRRPATTDAPHRQFQAAHDEYFQALASVCEETQRRVLDAEFELQRRLQKAMQSQDQKELQEAYEEYQRQMEEIAKDDTAPKRYASAYEAYKSAVAKAMASGNPEDLDPLTLSAIAQSLALVAQVASQAPQPTEPGRTAR